METWQVSWMWMVRTWRPNSRERGPILFVRCRRLLRSTSRLNRNQFWNDQKMSAVSTVLLSPSFHNVGSWLSGGSFNNANFLVTFVGLKSHNLLWIERWKRFGMLIVVGLLLFAVALIPHVKRHVWCQVLWE